MNDGLMARRILKVKRVQKHKNLKRPKSKPVD